MHAGLVLFSKYSKKERTSRFSYVSLSFSLTAKTSFELKMETLLLYNTIILIFSAIAFFCNLGSLIYIIKTFDIKQSFFHIFCMDALIVMGSTFISFLMSALSISGQNLKEFSCSVLFFGFSITVLTSPMTFQMISIIRYVESQFFCKSLKAKN